ncbi:MAG: nucleotidyl transferase AbiEii/AbiGii toxin family protein [candidate division WOR-3 bacterium]
MENLIKQEQFELEVLERLNSKRLLTNLVFGGGTMLRLCYGLDRFSVDLDFWLIKTIDVNKLFNDLKQYLGQYYTLTDSENKFYTLLLELKSKSYPRRLKIEIRKELKKVATENAIAYSKYSNTQVLLKVVSLEAMMGLKIESFLARKEIRDVFDIEFLLKKGISLPDDKTILERILRTLNSLTKRDYTVKLGSLLEAASRKYYILENFKILKLAINEKILRG